MFGTLDVRSQCQSGFVQKFCSRNDQTCTINLQTQLSNLGYLKASTLHAAFKSSFDQAPSFNNPYVCTNPTRYSTYIDYTDHTTGLSITTNNCSSVPNYSTCEWQYRVGEYETQLVVMKLLNEYSPETSNFVQQILNYSGDKTVTCFNYQSTGQFYYKIESIFSGVDLTTLPDYHEQNSMLVNTLTQSIEILTDCLNDEIQHQQDLQQDADTKTKILIAVIGICGTVLVLLLTALGRLLHGKYCKHKDRQERIPLADQAV